MTPAPSDAAAIPSERTAADLIAERLAAAGCRYAFGIPGGEVLTLIDALECAGVRFILAKHENAAGFMAEAAWHATGAPGVLVATVGPGLANAFNVVANAEQDRVPLIVLSGRVDPAEALTYTHQVFDHGAAFKEVCKASFDAPSGAVDVVIDKAVALAMAPRKGPVHLDVAIAVAAEPQPAPRWRKDATIARPPAPAGPAEGPALTEARARLAAATRPLAVAGLDVLEEPGGAEAVRAFVTRRGVPLLTTYKAKGILDEAHPLSLGGHGLSPKSDAGLAPILAEADLILSLGYDPIEMRDGWRDPWDPDKAIEVAHAPNTHYMHHAALSWIGSVTACLAALDTAPLGPSASAPAPWCAAHRHALHAAFEARSDWGPDVAIQELRAAAPAATVATADSGAHRILLSQIWRTAGPRQLLQSSGFCTMGCALPLAIGYKLARPETPVIAFIGDAGLEMSLGELATARDLGLPVVVVVFVDRSLALIELKQRRSGMQNVGVDFDRTDFARLAEAMGGRGVTVAGPGDAGPALTEALAADRFTVLEVEIPRRAYDGLF